MNGYLWNPFAGLGLSAARALAKERWPEAVEMVDIVSGMVGLFTVIAAQAVAETLGQIGDLAAESAPRVRTNPLNSRATTAVIGHGMLVVGSYPVEAAGRILGLAAHHVAVPALDALRRECEEQLKRLG